VCLLRLDVPRQDEYLDWLISLVAEEYQEWFPELIEEPAIDSRILDDIVGVARSNHRQRPQHRCHPQEATLQSLCAWLSIIESCARLL